MSEYESINESLDRLLRSALKSKEISIPEGFSARMMAEVRRREYQAVLDQVAKRERRLVVGCILVSLALIAIFAAFSPVLIPKAAAMNHNLVESLRWLTSQAASAGTESEYLLALTAALAAVAYAVLDWVFQDSASE